MSDPVKTKAKTRGWLPLRADLPLHRDAGAKFLPWILGIAVYVASLSAAVAIAIEDSARDWRSRLSTEATVELPAPADESAAERAARLDAVMEQIVDTPGVVAVRMLAPEEISALLRPWVEDDVLAVVPFPDLAAVTLAADIALDPLELEQRLAPISAGARVDTHADFAAEAMRFLRGIEISTLSLLVLVLASSIGLVGFAAATGLSIHRRVIEVLNLFGADDDYIARQFQLQTLRFGAPGAIIGAGAAAATLYFGFTWLDRLGAVTPNAAFAGSQILALAVVPLAALVGAFFAVRWVVIALLRRES